MPKRGPARVGALALVLLVTAGAAISTAAVIQQNGLRITVLSQIQPFRLPRTGTAPIAVFIAGHVAATDGGIPPQLERLTVKVNRHGLLQSKGLPVCQIPRVQPASTERALANCGTALIGSGQFWAHIILPGQDPYPTHGRLLIFNGRSACLPSSPRANHILSTPSGRLWPSSSRTQEGRGGERTPVRDPNPTDRGQRDAPCHSRPEILAHIFTSNPFATSFVIVFSIQRIPHGTYGTQLSASLPQALGSWGYVDRIKLTLRRKYRYRGKQRSYFNAGCPAPKGTRLTSFPLAYATFAFAGGRSMGTTVTKSCGVVE